MHYLSAAGSGPADHLARRLWFLASGCKNLGVPPTPARQLDVQALIAERYQSEKLLGQGGMGAVYAVFDPVTQRRVALKLLSETASPGAAALFEREYQTLASLKHPGVVEVYDYGRSSLGTYYTMELLEGADLSGSAPMPWREVCACLRDTAAILGVLHVRGLVHRDLSPRNLWRARDGRLKLIDFGALAPFGVAAQVTGTPPFVPPEALRGLPLDQRSDLYSLGALGYWLLTSMHAYPAKSLGELHALWTRPPARISNLVGLLASGQSEPLPESLEELLEALLRLDPDQRLRSTEELIDRLNGIANLESEAGDGAAQGYLQSKAFVGRSRELERFGFQLSQAERAQPQAMFVESVAGLGRSRLLEEMAIVARVAGATTFRLDARHGAQSYAVTSALAEQVLELVPEARGAAAAQAGTLAHLSARLRGLLGTPPLVPLPKLSAEARLRLQTSLQDWLLALSRERLLVIFVDDFHAIDEESQALLAVLARSQPGHKLLIVVSALREGAAELPPMVQAMHNSALRLHLLPLTRGETLGLLQSVFGDVPYLERMAERFQRLSEGNPSYCLELSQHLLSIGAVRYRDGAWTLPTELSAAQLPKSRAEGLANRLKLLTPEARSLAQTLSVPHHGALGRELCLVVSELPAQTASPLLEELVHGGVLTQSAAGYGFVHEILRETLLAELSAEQRSAAHLRFGAGVLQAAGDSAFERLEAGLHAMRGGDLKRGEQLQRDTLKAMLDANDFGELRLTVPLVAEGLALLMQAKRDPWSVAAHLTTLSCAGYYADPKYAHRYGAQTVSALEQILHLSVAQRLRRFVGARAALVIALICAGFGIALRGRRSPSLPDAIRYLFSAASALAGCATVSLDSKRVSHYAQVIEPLTALGPDHAASFIYRFTCYLALRCGDRVSASVAMAEQLVARLSRGPIPGLPAPVQDAYLAGTLFSMGVSQCSLDRPEGLAIADRLDAFGPLYKLSADHLRGIYYASQGNAAEAARYRQRVETHAIQLGSAWQVETWAPSDDSRTALLAHDAMGLKRAAQELTRLAEQSASLAPYASSAQAAYLVLRGKPREAIELLEQVQEPMAAVGWVRNRGVLARAYNALGEHASARDVCLFALSQLVPADLDYPAMNLIVPTELAIAEAGLGNFTEAHAALARLLQKYGPDQAPITLGSIHDAQVQVALREHDFTAASLALAETERRYRATSLPSLRERLDTLRRQIERAQRASAGNEADIPLMIDDVHLITRVQLILTQTGTQISERASKGLQIAIELSGADDGFIVLQGAEAEPTAYLGELPSLELMRWAHLRLMAAYASDETAAVEHVDSLIDLNLNVVDGVRYCVAPLWARRDNQDVVVAALALGFRKTAPRLPGADVLRVIADHLVNSAAPSSSWPPAHPVTS